MGKRVYLDGLKEKRLIDLLIQSIKDCGEQEGIWYGLSNEEEKELDKLINIYLRNPELLKI